MQDQRNGRLISNTNYQSLNSVSVSQEPLTWVHPEYQGRGVVHLHVRCPQSNEPVVRFMPILLPTSSRFVHSFPSNLRYQGT